MHRFLLFVFDLYSQERYGSLDGIKLVTLAPELPGALSAIKALSQKGIVVSIGHTQCSVKQATDAIRSGSSLVTHLFNAMRSFHHRDPGIVGLLGSDEPTYFSVIADGVHVRCLIVLCAHTLTIAAPRYSCYFCFTWLGS